ncbi:MAG: P-II family nitrogen regulator [Rhodothermales bacterium]
MKEIRAHVKPHRLSDVTLALHHVDGLTGMSVSEVKGFGRGHASGEPRSGREDVVDYVLHSRIEIFCRDEMVDDVVEAIRRAAHTGLRGDGKIYVLSHVEDAVRISTGERGQAAV